MVFFVILDLQYLCIAHKLISSLALWQLLNLLDQDLTVDIEKCDPKSEFLLRYCILRVSCNMFNLRLCVCVCAFVSVVTNRRINYRTSLSDVHAVCLFSFLFFFFLLLQSAVGNYSSWCQHCFRRERETFFYGNYKLR